MPNILSKSPLTSLSIDSRLLNALPIDTEGGHVSRQVYDAVASLVEPTEVANPTLIAHSRECAQLLGMDEAMVSDDAFANVFGGNALLPGMRPYALCYGGHQFGNWAGQLGDGRAIALGEVEHEGQHWVMQLKGAGPTPYSRRSDGRAVMRSSVREFLCSEAMHHLGVPTTRALSLVSTGDPVVRDMFYDGHPRPEPGAIVCRVSPSFLRFGNYQLFASRRQPELLRQLMDFTIETYFPELLTNGHPPSNATYIEWLTEIARRTADMIVHWMRVGFVHGVMNTDNMSILGLTIDYGPYGWLEGYDFHWTPNTTDAGQRRYAFGQQPRVALWNVLQLANAIYTIVDDAAALEGAVEVFERTFTINEQKMMANKLGFDDLRDESDHQLLHELVDVLHLVETDMTLFYRGLMNMPLAEDATVQSRFDAVLPAYYSPSNIAPDQQERIDNWLAQYAGRARQVAPQARLALMARTNPKYVLRNYLAQLAIDEAEKGNGQPVMALLDVLRNPYDEQPEHDAQYAQKRPEWARHRPGCSMLSCSS